MLFFLYSVITMIVAMHLMIILGVIFISRGDFEF